MSKKILQQFGDSVRKKRLEKKLSQESLAAKANVHRTYVGMIERAEKNITLENIEKFALALDCSISELFSESDINNK